MAVDRLPDFPCLPGVGEHLRGAISFSPSIDEMERAYDDAKYGHFSKKPYIDMIIPTLVDPTMAPPGKHVISCFVQYAPYKLAPELGTWDDQREAFGDAVVDRISRVRARTFEDIILVRNVQTPLDIERTTGLTEGNIFQGELTLEQLFFNRPVPGYARFRTPVRDLWLCGSSTHPAAGSWARTGGSPRSRCSARAAGGRPDGGTDRVRARATTRSSSAAATTGSSPRPISPRPASGSSCSSGASQSAARPRPRSSAACACRARRHGRADPAVRRQASWTSRSHGLRSSRRTSACSRRSPTAGR